MTQIVGFEWDEGNSKNWERHRVSSTESEEVFLNRPLLLQPDPSHSQQEARYYVLGQTNAGRPLFIAFTIRHDRIRVISARDMSRKERSIYAEANA